ncbi:hypothetical protein [Streptomyces globosus]|nr:hypothetical protein [Streptomyces globosus]
MFRNHEEPDVIVVAVAPVGAKVEVDRAEEVFDAEAAPPRAGGRLHGCVLDATREPFPRWSALRDGIAIARRLREDA